MERNWVMETIHTCLIHMSFETEEEFFTPVSSNEDSNESFWENYSTDYRIFINSYLNENF
jgi:hypothetical protein